MRLAFQPLYLFAEVVLREANRGGFRFELRQSFLLGVQILLQGCGIDLENGSASQDGIFLTINVDHPTPIDDVEQNHDPHTTQCLELIEVISRQLRQCWKVHGASKSTATDASAKQQNVAAVPTGSRVPPTHLLQLPRRTDPVPAHIDL